MSQQPLTDVFFESFDLHPSLLAGLHDAGFTRCTPIQALTLPVALSGRDVAGQAQTGTGKTAAFLVAVLNRLLIRPALAERKGTDPRAVILAPTRELAIQIEKDFRSIGRHTGLTSALIYGGVDYDKQRDMLRAGVDIVIATPGRIIDYLKQHAVSFRAVDAVVLDEADRMFDLGFIKDIRFLLRRMPPREERQNMLFSATLSWRVLELAFEHMNEPEKLVAETDTVTADRVRQSVYFPAKEEKLPLLIGLLSRTDATRSMVFVNTRIAAEKVSRGLERHGFRVGTLSGDVPQNKREKLLGRFERSEIEVLVATDVAARGLHIPAVSHVFNYDLPQDAEDYVHRIGRTARLGAEGDAISFACDLYAMTLPEIEAYIDQKLPVVRIEPELLIAPPHRAGGPAPVFDDEDDAARNTAGPPPKSPGHPQLRPRSGSPQRGGPRRERGGERHGPRPAKTDPDEAALAAHSPAMAAPAQDPAGASPKRRRRRGGRGGRNGAPRTETGASAGATHEITPAARGERAPRNERSPRGERPPRGGERPSRSRGESGRNSPPPHGAVNAVPTATAEMTPAHAKPGFFRRVARFFSARH